MTKSLQRRLRVFSFAVVLMAILLTTRLAWLQIHNYDHYLARAEGNRQRPLPITATRGEIFDANGELLATNRPGFAVSILGRDAPHVIAYLSELLEIEEQEIKDRIYKERFRRFAPIRIAEDVSMEVVAKIEEPRMELPGVIIETLPVRHYRYDSLAAHVLGYVAPIDRDGQSGVEKTWEQFLRGQDGMELVEVNSMGRRTRVLSREEPTPGHDLYLTLDARLQEISERVLAEVIGELNESGNTEASRGSVAAIDPNTGAILAMVSYPAYNLNTFRQDYPALVGDRNVPLLNRAIQGGYPVGSAYKMVTAMGALEEGLITGSSIVTCTGSMRFATRAWPCFRNTAHGRLNVGSALAKSCNVFFYEMGRRLGADRLHNYGKSFSFGQRTGLLDIEGERTGTLESGILGFVLNAAIGQGHEITPLQLANYSAMLANKGTHYRPYLVQQAVDSRGRIVFEADPEVLTQLEYSDANWEIVRKGMEAVTVPGGTASRMQTLPVKVAAKTGSAQAPPGISHSLFVGYAPAQAPEIALAVIVERGGLGSQGGVPVATRILQEYYAPPIEEDQDIAVEDPAE